MPYRLDAEGLTEVKRLLARAVSRQSAAADDGIKAALVHLHSKLAPYPPAPPDSSYVRGLDPRSERLSTKWGYEGRGFNQALVNNASYSGYVHGRRQPAYHKRTGWKTVEEVLREEAPRASQIIVQHYIRYLRRF